MIEYKPITIDDKTLIDSCFSSVSYRNCDFSFANLFCWQEQYQTTFALVDDFLLIRYICDDGLPCLMMPVGNADLRTILIRIFEDVNERGDLFRIHAITSDMFQLLDEALPNSFQFTPHRDYFEYIYATEDLIHLHGKKYQAKRNHINRFKASYPDYQYTSLNPNLIPACKDLYRLWVEDYNSKHEETVMRGEESAVFKALDNFSTLELKGGAILLDKQMIAFSIGQAVTEDTFVVYIEKALAAYQGAFQIINQEFIAHEANNYPFVNREEDLGLISLRQAKMSYYPVRFLERGSVCLKENISL